MKKTALSLLLAAAALFSACGTAPDTTPSATPTPDPAAAAEPTPEPEPVSFPVGHLNDLGQQPDACWNTGEALYELQDVSGNTPEGRVMKTDYATLTQTVYCSVPGCTHDSDACPAYLASDFCTSVMVVDGVVYTYPTELTSVAPDAICRIDPASGKTVVASVPDSIPKNCMFYWCDEYALYGAKFGYTPIKHQPNTLYRWDWKNGTVQTIQLLPDEKIVAHDGACFLTCHIAVDEPWPNFATNEQEEAILQHAVWEYSWLDPADGTRELICTQPYVYGSFFGYYDGEICYYGNFRNANTLEQQVDVLCFDTADGQEKTLMENWPCDTSAFVPPTFYPAFSGQSAPLVCAIKNMQTQTYMVDVNTGSWSPLPMLGGIGVQPVAVTDNGRWVVSFSPQERIDPVYHEYLLYDPQVCLAGGSPIAAFAMYTGE